MAEEILNVALQLRHTTVLVVRDEFVACGKFLITLAFSELQAVKMLS